MEPDSKNAVTIAEMDNQPLLMLQGSVDIFAAAELYRAARGLLEMGQDCRVNCERASHLDTSALQILLALKIGLREKGKKLQMVGTSSPVERLLGLAGLTGSFS